MEICPSDLGEGFAQQVIVRRSKGATDALQNFLFRIFFGRNTKLPYPMVERTLEQLLQPLTVKTASQKYLLGILFLLIGAVTGHYIHPPRIPDGSILVFGISLAEMLRSIFSGGIFVYISQAFVLRKSFVAPLTAYEASEMRNIFNPPQNAALAYAYLVQELVQAENIAPAAQPPLRDATRLLGEAVYQLANTYLPERDMRIITREMKATAHRAEEESDPVIKAALLRETRLHEQILTTTRSNARYKLHNDALLRELTLQIEALRVALPGFQTDNKRNEDQLTRLTENARTVTAEAMSHYHARAELDEAMTVSVGQR